MTSQVPWLLTSVFAVLLGLVVSKMNRRGLLVTLVASMFLLLAACGSDAVEQAQVDSVPLTPLPTTAPLSVPTPTPPAAPAALPEVTRIPVPTPTAVPTPTLEPDPDPTPASDAASASADGSDAGEDQAAEVIETATPVPFAPIEQPTAEVVETAAPEPTLEAETPTAVVASGELPLECFDREVQVYRAHVDGVDELSFEGGRVFCSGAGTNAVSAAGSYRHSTGLIVSRNADFIFNEDSTAYIPYSGSLHFCLNGQPASAPIRADTVPALLIVIDNEARNQVAQGATGPATFTSSGAQC